MKDIMVDLETLGTVPGCAILSIGAVAFDAADVATEGFYRVINTQSCFEAGLATSQSTLDWWDGQSPEARIVFDAASAETSPRLECALSQFSDYIAGFGDDVRVWGNGSDFDNAILAKAYEVADQKLPWKFYNSRCYRTLKSLHLDVQLTRTGTYHNALDDARSQAEHAVRLLQRQAQALQVEVTY